MPTSVDVDKLPELAGKGWLTPPVTPGIPGNKKVVVHLPIWASWEIGVNPLDLNL